MGPCLGKGLGPNNLTSQRTAVVVPDRSLNPAEGKEEKCSLPAGFTQPLGLA